MAHEEAQALESVPSEPTDPSRLLARAAELLFGPGDDWRGLFAQMFEINKRHLRRMLDGTADVPAGLLHDVEMALRDHGTTLDALLAEFP